ncbi:rhomboid family intramembrane serine protease, partial [Sinorhizobium meliloti]
MERDQAATSPETDVDSTDVRSREPAFNLPPGLTGILSFLIAVHVLRTYVLPAEIDQELILNFAFLPVRYTLPLGEQGLVWLWTPVTYSFLHGSWEHLIFNVFWMVAFGAPVVRRIGMARLALFWCLSAAAAVGLHIIFHWGEMAVVIGASGVVSG